MSYEGYEQVLCAKGHYREFDAYNAPDLNNSLFTCRCGQEYVWINGVDQTNGGDQGIIPLYKFPVLTPGVVKTCDSCGHTEQLEAACYGIPDKSLREYQPEDPR